MCAILVRAIEDAFGKGGPNPTEIRQARVFLTTNRIWFRQCCDFADIESECLLAWCRKIDTEGWPRLVLNDARERTRVYGGRDFVTPETEYA